MYQQALVEYKKVLDPNHLSVLNIINNLGNLYKAQDKSKKTEQIYQRALAGYEKVLGPDHSSTLNTDIFGIVKKRLDYVPVWSSFLA